MNGPPLQNGSAHVVAKDSADNNWQIFCFSSHERSGIQRMVAQHAAILNNPENGAADFLSNYAYTMGCRRSRLEWKSFYISNSIPNLVEQMNQPDHTVTRSTKQSSPKLCFLFCGQGSQWARMGCDLKSFPVFWNSLNSASWYLKTVLGSPFNLIEELLKDLPDSLLSNTDISQPATTAIQIAIVDLLRSFGIEPDFVVGHSSGEIAAAFACGALSREEAWEVAYYRGLTASTLRSKLPGFKGGMIAVSMSLEQAKSYINTLPDALEIACINSPTSITLSGKHDTIEHAARDLATKSIRHRVLAVDMAYHSTYMKKIEDDYVYNIDLISPSTSQKTVRMFSSVSGTEVQSSRLDANYWGKNMVSTVQFSSAIEALMATPEDQRPSMFIEMGPSNVLKTAALDTLASRAKPEHFFGALDKRQSGMSSILNIVGELWAVGYKINLKSAISRRFPQPRLKCLSTLPSYPWNHTKAYWHESHLSLANRFRDYGRMDLIGAPTADSVSFEPRWRGFLRASENPWIQDHQVQKTVIYPAAGMVSMVLEGARQLKESFPDLIGYEIRNMRFDKAIVVPDTAHGVEVALNMRAESASGNERVPGSHFTFSIYSKSLEKEWEKHATGNLHFCSQSQNMNALFTAFSTLHGRVAADCITSVNPRHLYEHLDTVGISYGPMFRNIVEVKKGADRCISKIRVPDTKSKMPAQFEFPHLIHPATLDSMFQTLFALEPVPKIPYLIQSIFVSDSLDLSVSKEFIGYATAKQGQSNDAEAEISMRCTDRPLDQVIIKGLCFSGDLFGSSSGSSFLPNYRNLCTEVVWREFPETADFVSFRHAMSLLCHQNPSLAILQIGGGFSLAKCVLLAVSENAEEPMRLGKYSLVDLEQSPLSFDDINLPPFSNYIEQLPDLTSVQSKYDLVLINDNTEIEVKAAEQFLKPGGVVLQLNSIGTNEKSNGKTACSNFELGWDEVDIQTEWHKRTGVPVVQVDDDRQPTMCRVPIQGIEWTLPAAVVLLLPVHVSEEVLTFETQLREKITVNYPGTSLSTVRLQDAVRDGSDQSDALYISLLDFSPNSSMSDSVWNWSEADFNIFHSLQSVARTFVWITRGANMTPTNPRLSPIIGLARTLMSEDMQKTFATFDIDDNSLLSEPRIMDMLVTVCHNVTSPGPGGAAREVDFAEKDSLYIPRLETLTDLNNIIERGENFDTFVEKSFFTEILETGHHVVLQSSLHHNYSSTGPLAPFHFNEMLLGEIAPPDVTISFESAILIGDMEAAAQGASQCQSYDVTGSVYSSGDLVDGYKRGDRVVALIPGGNGIRTMARVPDSLVTSYKPGFVPSQFLCAYYALVDIGKISQKKTVFIHAGASGFGRAAIELSLLSGATVFVTVVGSDTDKQRAILQERGLETDHILDGNADSYPSLVKLLTKNRGVDIVYNPTGSDRHLSLACVRRCK